MKNVTIAMDEEVLSWVRVEAAKRSESVSRFLATLAADQKRRMSGASQKEALDRFLAGPSLPLSDANGNLPHGRERYEPLLRGHEHPDLRPRSKRD